MPLWMSWIGALLAGMGVGWLYFGGLWWTTRQVPHVKKPGLWLLGSFIVRVSLCLAVFYLVMVKHPERIVFCMLGFILMRTWWLRSERANPPSVTQAT